MSSDNISNAFSLLPVEIWSHILRWESYTTLFSLSISCRQFHEIISPELFKNLNFRCPRLQPNGPIKLQALLNHDLGQNIYPLVRSLTVSSRPAREQDKRLRRRSYRGEARPPTSPDEPTEELYRLLERLPNLEILRWRGLSFPPQLFSNLEKRCPAPSFYYEGGLSQVIYHDLLMGAPYLKSLSITSRLEMMADRQIDINDLGALILSLPNLERLILKHYPGGPFRFQAISRPIFDLPPGSSLPPLQIISFANFSFTSQQAADWAKCLAQRDVRSLSLDGPAETMSTFIDCISCSIRTLNSVKIRVSDGKDPKISPHLNDSLDGLLRQNPALTSFAAYDLSTDALRSVIRYHGGHLRCLQFRRTRNGRSPGFGFRNVDAGRYYSPTAVYWDDECLFSPDDLRDLAYQLPAVERLGIDLSFKYKMPRDLLTAIASFPSLRFLELNMPAPNMSPASRCIPGSGPETWLNASVAEVAFRCVDDHRKSKMKRHLVRLDIKAGEWEPLIQDYRDRTLEALSIYSCWSDPTLIDPSKVHVLPLAWQLDRDIVYVEDSMFEQTMHAAGLWGVGCGSKHICTGPDCRIVTCIGPACQYGVCTGKECTSGENQDGCDKGVTAPRCTVIEGVSWTTVGGSRTSTSTTTTKCETITACGAEPTTTTTTLDNDKITITQSEWLWLPEATGSKVWMSLASEIDSELSSWHSWYGEGDDDSTTTATTTTTTDEQPPPTRTTTADLPVATEADGCSLYNGYQGVCWNKCDIANNVPIGGEWEKGDPWCWLADDDIGAFCNRVSDCPTDLKCQPADWAEGGCARSYTDMGGCDLMDNTQGVCWHRCDPEMNSPIDAGYSDGDPWCWLYDGDTGSFCNRDNDCSSQSGLKCQPDDWTHGGCSA